MKPKIVTESLTSLQRNLNQNKLKAKKKKKNRKHSRRQNLTYNEIKISEQQNQ